ncbi:hypothetical protein D9757_004284 [Collybiopsis confluens]|uniref:Carboxymuconolactone decarboxylase-like domain-containing protein n=1 Tax=Collybiopsis confluens TaxID=2823264 RepID=A0A8H5MCH2_9AGAR|nr:hypothetical protein D9757_004284 [Collybiopsis confluens]
MFLLSLTIALLSFLPSTVLGNGTELKKRDDNLPARVPYVFPPPGTDPIADAIRARRTNGTLLDLDGVLLNAPLIAEGEDAFFGFIRDNNTLPPAMRELFILRIAALNNASYEWLQHESVGRMAGLTTDQLLAIRLAPPFFASQGVNLTATLGPDLVAAMTFADWITKNVHVPDDVFDGLRAFLNDSQLVEATATTAGYNFISRFVVALNVDAKMDVAVPVPS